MKIIRILISGILGFIYCIAPIVQYNCTSDKYNDHYIFFISSEVYGFMQLLYTDLYVYIVQFILWLLIWLVLYWIIVFISNVFKTRVV